MLTSLIYRKTCHEHVPANFTDMSKMLTKTLVTCVTPQDVHLSKRFAMVNGCFSLNFSAVGSMARYQLEMQSVNNPHTVAFKADERAT